jgi:V/A-type H+-transporting ATPase subunit C
MAYEAVNTKIISKRGHIVDREQWDKILGFTSVDQLTEYFKNHIEISSIFEGLNKDSVHRDSLEAILNKYRRYEIEELLHYFSGPYKDFIKSMLIEEEIRDISLILRKITRKESLQGIEESFVHSPKYSKIPYDKLMASNNVEQFNENLKDTPYYGELRNLTDEDALKREFHIEMKLQLIYYNTLLKRAESLEKADVKKALDLICYKIDLENIQWIYRAKNYYSITPEEILIYSLNGGRKINFNRLKILCYAKSMDEFKQISNSFLKFDFFENENKSDITIDKHLLSYLRKNRSNDISSVIAYVIIIGIVIDDLTSIVEGIKYNVPKEKIKQYLAFKM